jgi:hypothetical protein
MFRLIVAILVFVMGDWIFFDGNVVVRRLMGWIEAGMNMLADLIIQLIG